MAPYKIPSVLKVVDEIPRNKMGKGTSRNLRWRLILVNKKQLVIDAFQSMEGVQK
jgi:acyl-coenzyme A synthetase/AMP-(fatty) acid ligase